jgi:proteasome accessory factor B
VDRLERLVNLVVALLDTRRPLTREELRERVGGYSDDEEAFRRNFERDKELLRDMGVPLLAEPLDPLVPDGAVGYRVPKDLYQLEDPGLDEEELMALSLAGSAVALEGPGQAAVTSALRKLAGASANAGGSIARPEGQGAALADLPVGETVAALFAGVAARQAVSFTYNGERRVVDPYRLSYRQGRWYLAGYDHARGAERLFRADRAGPPVATEGPPGAFELPDEVAGGPPPPWRLGDDEEVVALVRVDPGYSEWAERVAGQGAVVERGTSGTYLELRVTNREAFRGFVLGFLEHAEVVGPPELREEMVEWLRTVAAGAPEVLR